MDAGEWFRWAAAFVLGALSTVAIEFGRGQLERRQRKQDRRDEFQREKMIELLDPARAMMEFLHRFYYPMVAEWWEIGFWDYSPDALSHLTEAQEFEYEEISVKARTLSHLIADEQIGEPVEMLLRSARKTFGAQSQKDADAAYTAAHAAYLSIAKRVGELQQKL